MSSIVSSKLQSGPQDIPGADPQLIVTPDPVGPLKPGKYVFSVVVTDDAGIQSAVATANVEVRNAPAVKLAAVPAIVAFNAPITLNASVATTGVITNFNWSIK